MVSDANFFDLTETQRKLLQKTYEKIQQPDAPILEQLVGLTGLNVRIVRAWFQNERKKEKKALKEMYKKQEKLKKKAHKKQQQKMKEKQVISDSSYSDLSCHGGSSSETSSDAYSSSSSGSEGEEEEEEVTDSSEEEADEEWRAKKKAKEEKENPMKKAESSMMKMLNENPQKTAIQKQQMMMGKLKMNAENMMDDYWQMHQQQPQQRKKDANANKATANGAPILPMPNAPPLTPSVASTSSASQLNPRGFGQGLFSGQQQKSTETKGKMDKQMPMPSNQRHNIDGAGWKWRLLKIICCIFICILIQLFYSSKLKPGQKNVLNGRIKMINRTFSNPNRKSSSEKDKMAKDEAVIVPPAYSSYYPEFPEALYLQNDYSDFLQILPIFEEIQMDPVNFTTLLDSDELEASRKHGKLAGFEWELAMLKNRQNLLFIVISAKNANANAKMDYNLTGEIEFYINLEYPDIGIAPNCGKEEEAQFRHKRHCIFNSLEGGKCGLLMANPERHLRRFFVGQQSQSLLAQIGVLLHLNVPPQKEAIENL